MQDTQHQELYELINQAHAERDRISKIEDMVGTVLFTVLGVMTVSVIIGWSVI